MNIKDILYYINSRFNQTHMPEYNVPYKIENTIVFFWSIGAIILYDNFVEFIKEDDGYWFESHNFKMSSAWIPAFTDCLLAANKYLEENGEPYYFSGTNFLCGYRL